MATVYHAALGSLADWSTDCGHWRIYGPIAGFAMNPARDFGPKVFAWLAAGAMSPLPAAETFLTSWCRFRPYRWRDCRCICLPQTDWSHLPCDICVVEEKETTTPSEQKLRCNMTTGQLNMTEKKYIVRSTRAPPAPARS